MTGMAALFGVPAPVHLIVHPDDEAGIAADAAVLDGWIHVRSSVLVEPGTAISLDRRYGAINCPRCDPDGTLAFVQRRVAAAFPVRAEPIRMFTEPQGRADRIDFAAILSRYLDPPPRPPLAMP